MKVELHKQAIALLEKRYNILFATDCQQFDTNPAQLQQWLEPFKHKKFSADDKILLVHMDTDYYDPLLNFGLIPVNTVRIFLNLDIPLHAMLFVTNHFGISREFDQLLIDHHPADRPKVIETLLSNRLLTENLDFVQPPGFTKIEKPAVCMMRQARSHRIAFFNFLKNHNLLDKIAVSQHFNA